MKDYTARNFTTDRKLISAVSDTQYRGVSYATCEEAIALHRAGYKITFKCP